MVVNAIVTYMFLKRLLLPFNKWEAFRLGVIDDEGNVLIPQSERTPEQKDSFRSFDVMIRNLKNLLAKVPGGSSLIARVGAAIYLMKEDRTPLSQFTEKQVLREIMELGMRHKDLIKEDLIKEDAIPTNSSSGSPTLHTSTFAGRKVFSVNPDVYSKCIRGKPDRKHYRKWVDEDDVGENIRSYARKNPRKSVLIQNSQTGEMVFLRRKD